MTKKGRKITSDLNRRSARTPPGNLEETAEPTWRGANHLEDKGLKSGTCTRLAIGAGVLMLGGIGAVFAADHLDPAPTIMAGEAADIADLYAWNTDTLANNGNLVVALTFAGPVPGAGFTADRDVIYGIHIDNDDAMHDADADIWVRFAQDSDGIWGAQISGIPGTSGPVVGPVGSIIDIGGAQVFTGVREDPFFFDLQGFRDTLMTGALSFNPARDFFAGQNVSTVVIELPLRALPGDGPYHIWATSARI